MSKKETPLFPLRKGLHARQAHVDLPPGTFEEEHARNGFSAARPTSTACIQSRTGRASKAHCGPTATT